MRRTGLGFLVQPQRPLDVPHDQGVPAGDDRERQGGGHRQRRLDRLVGEGRAEPFRLRRLGLTRSVAVDFVKHNVRCNAICPGTVDTPSLGDRIAALGDVEAARKAFIARQPLGRLGTAEEIAELAVYLASDDASFATGAEFKVDGGMTM